MTPKEKAIELVYKFMPIVECGDNRYSDKVQKQNAKQCALIAVDEILNNFGTKTNGQTFYTEYRAVQFWQQVKTEIEKL